MITKTANAYLLKEAYSLQELQDDVSAKYNQVADYLKDLNARRIANGYTAGNAVSKLGIGSDKVRKELAENGLINFVSNHGGKRLSELNALKDQIMEKARAKANDLDNYVYDKRQQLSNAISGGRLNDLQKKFDRAADILDLGNKGGALKYIQDDPKEEY